MSNPLTLGTLAAILKNGETILDLLDYTSAAQLSASLRRVSDECLNQLLNALNGLHAHLGVLRNAEIGGGK